jgi:hypothetical protein
MTVILHRGCVVTLSCYPHYALSTLPALETAETQLVPVSRLLPPWPLYHEPGRYFPLSLTLVPGAGIEPARPFEHEILSLGCLPVSPSGQFGAVGRTRTHHLMLTKQLLCQMSYNGIILGTGCRARTCVSSYRACFTIPAFSRRSHAKPS